MLGSDALRARAAGALGARAAADAHCYAATVLGRGCAFPRAALRALALHKQMSGHRCARGAGHGGGVRWRDARARQLVPRVLRRDRR